MSNWHNNAIQFPRLLAEINATQDLHLPVLAESMDLAISDINELFDRAGAVWERAKAGTVPAVSVAIPVFNDKGVALALTQVELTPDQLSDVLSQALQVVQMHRLGDAEGLAAVLAELDEACGATPLLTPVMDEEVQ